MKDIKTQNSLVVDVMGENTVALKNCIKDRTPTYTKIFPIKTLEILKSLEENINETNEKEYIASIRAIIGNKGLKKGLCDIVSTNLLVDFNLHGDREKKRLLDYPKFLHVLFGGTYNENSTDKSFKQELREALRVAKNRFHKEKYLIKKKNQAKENNPKPTSPRGVFQDQVNSLLENL